MTKAKRFLSAVMAVVMVMTMLSCLGVVASAYVHDVASMGAKWTTETTPGGPGAAMLYDDLAALYGDVEDNTTTPWVYLALEAYEKVDETVVVDASSNFEDDDGVEWTLTDHYVQPDQELFFKFYQKSNCYGGTWQYSQQFDRTFFDVLSTSYKTIKNGTYTPATKTYSATSDKDGSGLYTGTYVNAKEDDMFFGGIYNENNPYWEKGNTLKLNSNSGGLWQQTKRNNDGTTKCGLDPEITAKWDVMFAFPQAGQDDTSTPELFNDEYLYSFRLKVRSTAEPYMGDTTNTVNYVPEGTVGHIGMDMNMTRIADSGRYIYTNLAAEEGATLGAASNMQAGGSVPALDANSYMTEDCNHTFKIGNPPVAGEGYTAKFFDGATEYTALEQTDATTITLPAAQTKEGYTFGGWNDGTTTYAAGASYTLTANTNFTAVWDEITYSIKYFDGASEYASLAQTATYTNNSITLPAAQTKTGFRFDGWSDGTTTYAAGASYTVSADTNFSAVWTQLYTATFVDEDSTSYGSAEYAAGETITFPTVTAREGFTYAWDPALTTMPAQNQTFTLRWTAAGSSINFESNGGSAVAPITGSYGDPVTAPADPTKTGYHFDGWFSDSDLTVPYSFTTMPATAITVYAKWTAKNYNANFYIDGETDPYETVSAAYDSTFTAPALPTETGYSFSPWTPSDFVMNAEGRDYYTTKTANSYTITFKDRDGNVLQSTQQTYGNVLQLATAPTITGEPFSGWSGDDGSFIADGTTDATVPARNTVYTATYNQTLYTLTYYVDGEVVHTDSYAYNAAITPYSYTAPTGKTVSSWKDANEQNLPLRMPAEDLNVYATTSWIEYTLTFLNKDGSEFASVPAHYGEIIEDLEPATDPTAAGYAFAGWDYVDETVTGDLSIPGIWNALSYNVEFVYGEPATSHAGGAATYGSTISSASFPDASVEGKSYVWQYEGANVGSSFAVPALPAGSTITFTAVYSAQTYTIEYQVNGSRVATESYAYGAPITPRALPTETGYDVTDWVGLPQDLLMPAQNITVTCTKTPHVYTDTWYDIDGTTVKTTTQVAYLDTITAPEINPDDYPGMQGLQWSPTPGTQEAADMEFYLVGSGATVDVTVLTKAMNLDGSTYTETTSTINGITGRTVSVPGNMRSKTGFTLNESASTLSATVAGDGSTQLVVVFDRNKYQINVTDDANIYSLEYYFEEAVPALEAAGKTGYTFDSWTWTRANNGAAASQPATMPAYSLNAVAKYNINSYNFTTYVDGVAGTPVSVRYDAAVNEPAAQTREGYTFDGWYTDDTYATKVTFPFNMPAEDVNVYARFNINSYTYTFNTDGGTEIASITAEYGAPISVANPEKEGYTFKAWNPSLPATMGAGDQTFTAVYQINSYTVTFKNGDATVKTVTANYGTELASLAAPTVSKTGYTFTGWAYADGEGTAYEGTTVPAYNLVADAQFSVNSYDAVFYAIAGDATAYTTISDVEFGTTFVAPECTATREYYEFTGWTDGTNTYEPGDEITMDAVGKTFTGVWAQDTSACRVESVVRVTEGYYQLGVANYDVTLVAGVHPDTLIIDTGADGIFYLARFEFEVGRTQMIKNIREEDGKEIWTVALSLEESQNGAYGAYCEVDGVEDSPFKFDVTYDIKDDAAIAADFTSADISGLTAVRGDVLTWTVTTTTKVAWLKFVGTYTDGAGEEQELITFYKASNYKDGDGVETAKVTDADGVRTWVIPMVFNYPGTEDLVLQTWNIQYRCTGSYIWETGVVSDGNGGYTTYAPQVTVAKKAEALEPAPTPEYDKFTLISVEADKANASIGDTIVFTVLTTSDASKVRVGFVIVSDGSDNGKTKTATYQTTSSNASVADNGDGTSTWTISLKVNKVAQNGAFDIQCRGLSWGEVKTATVAISA